MCSSIAGMLAILYFACSILLHKDGIQTHDTHEKTRFAWIAPWLLDHPKFPMSIT